MSNTIPLPEPDEYRNGPLYYAPTLRAHAAAVSAAKDARIKVLEEALRMVAASHAWQLFGECRAFGTDRIPSPGQCHEIARAALGDKT